jgi:hypothetical protein
LKYCDFRHLIWLLFFLYLCCFSNLGPWFRQIKQITRLIKDIFDVFHESYNIYRFFKSFWFFGMRFYAWNFEHFRFNESFISWDKTLYSDIQTCVMNNGWVSENWVNWSRLYINKLRKKCVYSYNKPEIEPNIKVDFKHWNNIMQINKCTPPNIHAINALS